MKKYFVILLALFAIAISSSCEREEVIYFPDNACVSFPSDVSIVEMLAADGNKITVELWRGNTNGSVSVPVTVTGGEGIFTPSKTSFDFVDGQSIATIDLNYPDINDFGGETYKITVSLSDESMVSPSGYEAVTISAQRKLTRKFLGTGIYYSDWYEAEWEQDLYTTEEAPDLYILPNCWVTGTDFTFNMVNGTPVWPNPFFSGYVHSTYGEVFIYHDGSYIEDGVIFLPVTGYRVSAGSFGGGMEYFVLPDGVVLR